MPPLLFLLLSEPGLSGLIGLLFPLAGGASSVGYNADIELFPLQLMTEIRYAVHNEGMDTGCNRFRS